jgi:hypothetical protein
MPKAREAAAFWVRAPPTPSAMPLYILFTKWFIKDGISNGMDNTISDAYQTIMRDS